MKSTAVIARDIQSGFLALGWECIARGYGDPDIPGDTDAIVCFGWMSKHKTQTERTAIIADALRRSIPVLCVELGTIGTLNRAHWRHLGWNGVNGRSVWITRKPGNRWDKIFRPIINVRPWRTDDQGPIVVLGQKPFDVSLENCRNYMQWLQETIKRIGNRAVFRPHPKALDMQIPGVPNDTNGLLETTLKTASATMTWNSSAGVQSVIAGVPHYCEDRGSMAWEVSRRVNEMGRDSTFDRQPWLDRLAYSIWHMDEIRSGEAIQSLLSCMPGGVKQC